MADDWDKPTVIRKNRLTAKDARSASAVNQAMASGNVSIQKKMSAGGNKQGGPSLNLSKIDQETENFKVNTVDKAVSKAIIAGRQQKDLTQKDLATLISEKIQVVQEYEHGKAVPNQQVLGKLERALGVKLRGEGIGSILEKPAKKA